MRGLQKLCFLLTLVCLIFTSVAGAQTDTGRIVGTVTDSTGAVIPGVTVSVVSEKTGQERTGITNAQGDYVVTPLPPETYTVKASLASLSAPEYKEIGRAHV